MAGTLIFGGTTEGREAARQEKDAVVCVTSAYAASLLPPGTDCRVGRLNRAEMLAFMERMRPDRVVDATHPYAAQVTANIQFCCQALNIPRERVLRPALPGAWRSVVRTAKDAADAARLLSQTDGNILLTTGSQTLKSYTAVISARRIWARVLPTARALELCEQAGVPPSHVIAMQGPFSTELNAALYDQLNIHAMVTKDSGAAGGLEEKVLPALAREIDVILIERPKEDLCAEKA